MEAIGHVFTATGLCLQCSVFSPSWLVVQTVIYLVSTGMAVFDVYTDWVVVLNFQEVGFNNPLLPKSLHWLRALYLFVVIGTVLGAISMFQDTVGILYSWLRSFKRCYRKSKGSSGSGQNQQHNLNTLPSRSTEGSQDQENSLSDEEEEAQEREAQKKEDDKISDPCLPCYRCGCNSTTRKENLALLILWFHNVPMLTISILYALSQSTCKVPDRRDVSPILRDVAISATAATLSSSWRFILSYVRLYKSVGSRIKEREDCSKRCTSYRGTRDCVLKTIPKKGDVLFPSDTRIQCCIFPFLFGVALQLSAIIMAGAITLNIWIQFISLARTPNFDDSLGIYRTSLNTGQDLYVLNISEIITPPPNATAFLHFEEFSRGQVGNNLFCLSEFEYRSEESLIFLNTIELMVVSNRGEFCVIIANRDPLVNFCALYYLFRNAVLFYASADPNSGFVTRFGTQCSVVNFDLGFQDGPVGDFSIDVTRHVDRTGFPENNEPLVVFYPTPISTYLLASAIFQNIDRKFTAVHTFEDLETSENVTCALAFAYDDTLRQITYNYRDVVSDCDCPFFGQRCDQFHQNLTYGYLQEDHIVPYTHCPPEKLVPQYDPTIFIRCPCTEPQV